MSDEDRDIEIESDDDDDDLGQSSDNTTGFSQAEKRAHHNALERKRRDHIKDSFTSLRDSVPLLQGEKVNSKVSRAQILKKASEYIVTMRKKNSNHQKDIEDLKKQNEVLENKIKILEKSLTSGKFSKQASNLMSAREPRYNRELSESESSETEEKVGKRRKKLKS